MLVLDEIDSLSGDGLIAILRQLRANYPLRPAHFQWSIVLCGVRDVRDYRASGGADSVRLGTASPFNIEEESLRLGNFTEADVAELDEYLAKLGLDEGTLVIFDARSAAAPIEDRTRFEEAVTPSGRKVTVLRA